MSTEKPCHFVICCKFQKKISLMSDLYIIFHVFIHVYSSEAGADNPLGQKFYVNIYLMSLWSFAVSFFH